MTWKTPKLYSKDSEGVRGLVCYIGFIVAVNEDNVNQHYYNIRSALFNPKYLMLVIPDFSAFSWVQLSI